ncbi:hypothetical protein ACH4E7_39310 [Kitasatospora sp. NPDC018058]|uniref:hypothetical protein n=1 Tax=Kitasatospora sp. NPDC018058 TaxID=3364025 RepID=UPI0037C0329A
MQLAIGDVVRDRSDMTLGTVAGAADQADGSVVVIQLSGGELRQVQRYDLELVGRRPESKTAGGSVASWGVHGLAFTAATLGGGAELASGGGWLLAFLVGLGSSSAVMTAVQAVQRMAAPRRIHV